MLEVLIHQAQVEIQSSDVGVVLTGGDLQNGQGSVHVLESPREVTTRVMVKSEVRISISGLRMVATQNSLLQNDALSLQVNGLKEIPEFKLNAGKFGNACSYFLVHGPCNLKQSVNALTVKIKCTLKGLLLIGLLGCSQEAPNIIVLKLKMLNDWEYLSKIT